MDELAKLTADYYKALLAEGLPDELARHLTLDWQQSMLNHAHFVIMERNLGLKQYAKYYTQVAKNYVTNVMKAPTLTVPEMVDAVSRRLGRVR